tara:strand:- start:1 stop:609 length:609 start_codon:yes stop_codon:yes gene_type:complete
MTSKYLFLYHGTSSKNLEEILDKGISPRYKRESVWKENPSRDDMVYLTNAYAPHFAQCSVDYEEEKLERNTEHEAVVFKVKVDVNNLYPDEDFLEQITRHDEAWKDTLNLSMEFRTLWFKDNLLDYKDNYQNSLKALGNCCHKGIIKPKDIVKYTVLKSDRIIEYSDPTITLKNYLFLGKKYRNICDKVIWSEEYSKQVVNL